MLGHYAFIYSPHSGRASQRTLTLHTPCIQNIRTGPDNIDRSLDTLTIDLATNWGISTQTVLRPPMAAVNATPTHILF